MKIEIRTLPPAEPERVFDIEGLTLDEAVALMNLLGRFACNPGPPHWHTKLFAALERATSGLKRHNGTYRAGLGGNVPDHLEYIRCVEYIRRHDPR